MPTQMDNVVFDIRVREPGTPEMTGEERARYEERLRAEGKPVLENDHYYKLAIVVRKDLDMRCGKAIAQAIHAAIDAFESLTVEAMCDKHNASAMALLRWNASGRRVVVLKAQSLPDMSEHAKRCTAAGLKVNIMRDAGLTQVEPHTITCMAVGPDAPDKIDAILGDLKLY